MASVDPSGLSRQPCILAPPYKAPLELCYTVGPVRALLGPLKYKRVTTSKL